ncbi:MAG TPA: hypothetical protein VFR43_06900 [Gaiellaceae bacterium]|nr:hypothetical protein [Gaiellaceae bacterium]
MEALPGRGIERRAANTDLWRTSGSALIPFLCECGDETCAERVPLTASAFRSLVEAGGRPVSATCLRRAASGRP